MDIKEGSQMSSDIDNITVTITDDELNTMLSNVINNTGTYTIIGSNGTSAYDWSNMSITSNNTHNSLEVKGDANFEGDVTVKGKSIVESLEKIEDRLAILHPNEELEEKWEQLRGLRKAYMELEAEIIEKEKVWKILQK